MPQGFRATTLRDVPLALSPDPLAADDRRYADLSDARGGTVLGRLRLLFEDRAQIGPRFIHAAFVGHRGSGKSTELLRLGDQLRGRFTPLHLYVDPSLERDADYSDLALWLVSEIDDLFKKRGWSLDSALLDEIAGWFAERTFEKSEELRKDVGLEASAEASAGWKFPGFGAKIIARLKSAISGSVETRHKTRRTMERYADELRERVNAFLDHVHVRLREEKQPPRLLVIQDNLDRLLPDPARRLFFDNADFLRSLRADFIWTAPVGMQLAPYTIRTTFPDCFQMPVPAPRRRDGADNPDALKGLLDFIDHRVSIEEVFDSPEAALHLAGQCGGSLRDLVKMLGDAQLDARVRDCTRIDLLAARHAVKNIRLDFENALHPGSIYYPILVSVHRTKQSPDLTEGQSTREAAESARAFFYELMLNGSILQYNGENTWFDVHPAVAAIPRFQDAFQAKKAVRKTAPRAKKAGRDRR